MSNITLGIIGGGQLGCLLSQAANKLNIETVIFSDDKNSPAKNLTKNFIIGNYDDENLIKEFLSKVVSVLRRDFKVGSEDSNDVLFVGQWVKWIDYQDPRKSHIRVDPEIRIEELSEIAFDSSSRDNIKCTTELHR